MKQKRYKKIFLKEDTISEKDVISTFVKGTPPQNLKTDRLRIDRKGDGWVLVNFTKIMALRTPDRRFLVNTEEYFEATVELQKLIKSSIMESGNSYDEVSEEAINDEAAQLEREGGYNEIEEEVKASVKDREGAHLGDVLTGQEAKDVFKDPQKALRDLQAGKSPEIDDEYLMDTNTKKVFSKKTLGIKTERY